MEGNNEKVSITSSDTKRPLGFPIFLIVAGFIGLTAAFALTLETPKKLLPAITAWWFSAARTSPPGRVHY
jgi:hypothetical protein